MSLVLPSVQWGHRRCSICESPVASHEDCKLRYGYISSLPFAKMLLRLSTLTFVSHISKLLEL